MTATAGKRVLVVEDDPLLQKLVAKVLRRSGLEVDTADDGLYALEKITTEHYDLILLDLMMPRLDGLGFLEALHESGYGSRFEGPIIAMTAATEVFVDRLDGTRVQAILRKPFDLGQLASFVSRALAS